MALCLNTVWGHRDLRRSVLEGMWSSFRKYVQGMMAEGENDKEQKEPEGEFRHLMSDVRLCYT